jgi:hypothetical protein
MKHTFITFIEIKNFGLLVTSVTCPNSQYILFYLSDFEQTQVLPYLKQDVFVKHKCPR